MSASAIRQVCRSLAELGIAVFAGELLGWRGAGLAFFLLWYANLTRRSAL